MTGNDALSQCQGLRVAVAALDVRRVGVDLRLDLVKKSETIIVSSYDSRYDDEKPRLSEPCVNATRSGWRHRQKVSFAVSTQRVNCNIVNSDLTYCAFYSMVLGSLRMLSVRVILLTGSCGRYERQRRI